VIEVEGLAKRFGAVEAVRDVSFTARDGRITGLLGPNGAGKSTTLRILYTALGADAGHARVDGIDVAADPLGARRRIGVLPHGAGIYPQLTARENVRYYGELHGLRGTRWTGASRSSSSSSAWASSPTAAPRDSPRARRPRSPSRARWCIRRRT
jgi:ABC-type Na+ transport system ATPase subunit NatA